MSGKPLDRVGTTDGVGKHDFRPSPTEPIVHGVGDPPVLGLVEELAAVTRERDALKACLDRIACWNESSAVAGSFDEPRAAEKAREILTALASGDLRKRAS